MQQKQFKERSLQRYRPTSENKKNLKSNLTIKGTRKGRTKLKGSRRKEMIKIRAEINNIETKNQKKISRKLKADSLER